MKSASRIGSLELPLHAGLGESFERATGVGHHQSKLLFFSETEALQAFLERASDALRALDEHHAVGPTGIRFESERAGPREEIEHRAALERTERRKQRLAHAIGRRPDAVGNAPEVTAAEMTADDSHGSGLHLLDTSTTCARIAVGNNAAD